MDHIHLLEKKVLLPLVGLLPVPGNTATAIRPINTKEESITFTQDMILNSTGQNTRNSSTPEVWSSSGKRQTDINLNTSSCVGDLMYSEVAWSDCLTCLSLYNLFSH